MCRKLETEEEKVLPFYASSLTDEEQKDVAAVVQEPPTQPLAEVDIPISVTQPNRTENMTEWQRLLEFVVTFLYMILVSF